VFSTVLFYHKEARFAMVKKEFLFPSADKKTSLHAVEWTPDGQVRAVLQIAHGVSEHILRYEPFAKFLTDHGFAVAGHDHIGHGASLAPGASPIYFGPKGSWNTVVKDLETRRQMAAEQFPGVPYFLLGHSMGSFLARTYLIRYPGSLSGAVIMGTGQMPPALIAGGKTVAALEALRLGEDKPSPLVTKLSFGPYNKIFEPNRTAFDWLSRNQENVDRYIADPLCGAPASTGLFREMLSGISFISKPENLGRMDRSLPVLFISGEMDPVGDCGKGVRLAFESFRTAGVSDVTLKLYPELRHEILNETERDQVYADILGWLEHHM